MVSYDNFLNYCIGIPSQCNIGRKINTKHSDGNKNKSIDCRGVSLVYRIFQGIYRKAIQLTSYI